jgi:hypothetical protein
VLPRAQSWEAITNGGIGTTIIIGAAVVAGSERQAEDRIRYRTDIAADRYRANWPSRIDDANSFELGDSP